jgi:hypothetical protein
MPSLFNINPLRAGALLSQATLERAHDKENPFAPVMVSQEEAGAGPHRSGAAACRRSNTE